MYVVTVEFRTKPGAEGRFLELVTENAARSLADEPGCQRFDVRIDDDLPGEVLLYELYDDQAAFERHKTMPHYLEFSDAAAPLIAEKLVTASRLEEVATGSGARSAIRREADRPRHARGGGASAVQMVTPDAGARSFINGFTDIPPGAGIARHFHNCEESVLIVSGRAMVEIDGQEQTASASDVVWIAANVPHRFRNPSATVALRIFWTYASAAATRTLVETGEERPVVSENGGPG